MSWLTQLTITFFLLYANQVYGIIHGRATTLNKAPWIVSLSTDNIICAGVQINDRTILTTADCVLYLDAAMLKVRVGSVAHDSGGAQLSVTDIIIHPKYVAHHPLDKNNIAILHLEADIPSSVLTWIPFGQRGFPLPGDFVTLYGWGPTTSTGEVASMLNQGYARSIKTDVCLLDEEKRSTQGAGNFCHRGYGNNSTIGMVCAVDAGGPITMEFGLLPRAWLGGWLSNSVLVGLMTKNGACGSNMEDIGVRTGDHRQWIKENTLRTPRRETWLKEWLTSKTAKTSNTSKMRVTALMTDL